MKRKFADRANWRRVTDRRFLCRYIDSRRFTGYVTLYNMLKLKEPLMKTYGGLTFCVADKGYSWLQYFPKDAHFIVTTMFNEKREVVEWYIDICKSQGVTDQGVPWFDDLYLDIVVLGDGTVFLLDEDELDDALRRGVITEADYALATRTAHGLLRMIDAHAFPYFRLSIEHRRRLFPASALKV
ncbi:MULTISPECIES: DUF402 domain-containing protein [Saccharibacillus]|uniref:DUF402 domain-containing protein n=2 Tax=Saccharibacillus TaxID=456492 RepID=A0A4Y6V4S1_SACBS|nr:MULTISPECIES: DUF402 domain-containing protein [Saccharibacillus]OWA37333.1 hypothetical protein B9G55_04520 [Saccharibacillus sp. O16]MWJ30303.1 DUF402 domain-containing protein [Saccharibacillus sp. WB 17]NGZ74471.1 DUF402 domain-containing protein [Saccharibacillus alkalitolerans]OWR32790.1 hypothetical protein CDO73_04115 [Saccharibacillus sp. O23]QDH23507.1 DUF402 domain-containing protein [Saccharibacillus brassicae]